MTCEVDVEGQVLGDLRVDVGAQRVLVIGNRRVLQEALLILVTELLILPFFKLSKL